MKDLDFMTEDTELGSGNMPQKEASRCEWNAAARVRRGAQVVNCHVVLVKLLQYVRRSALRHACDRHHASLLQYVRRSAPEICFLAGNRRCMDKIHLRFENRTFCCENLRNFPLSVTSSAKNRCDSSNFAKVRCGLNAANCPALSGFPRAVKACF